MRGRRRRTWPARGCAAATAVALVALTGCSHTESATTARDEIDRLLDATSPDEWSSGRNPFTVQAEEAIATCMADAGFEYHPEVDDDGQGWSSPPQVGDLDFAERYGYGVFTELEPGTVPWFWRQAPSEDSEPRRRNREYRESLSPDAAAAYETALNGDGEASGDGDGADEFDVERSGCAGKAYDEYFPDQMVGPRELSEVKKALLTWWQEADQDPEVVNAAGVWADCMADAGYLGLRGPGDAWQLPESLLFPRWQDRHARRVPVTGVTDYENVRTQIPDALVEIQQAEIALAVADATCRQSSGYTAAHTAAADEIDRRFLEMFRDDLEAWAAWAAEQRAARG